MAVLRSLSACELAALDVLADGAGDFPVLCRPMPSRHGDGESAVEVGVDGRGFEDGVGGVAFESVVTWPFAAVRRRVSMSAASSGSRSMV